MKRLFVFAIMAATATSAVGAAEVRNIAPPPPPPLVLMAPDPSPNRLDYTAIAVLDVAVTAGRETLWSGPLKVNNSGVSYSESLREAQEPCPTLPSNPNVRNYDNQRRLNIMINRMISADAPDRFSVRIEWTRLVPACNGSGSRSVSLNQQVNLAPGGTARVEGDAGLLVTLKRRVN